jgi:cardiolipin synthase
MSLSAWDREKLLFDGDAYFESLLHAWSQAKSSIDFETYIFDVDPVGVRVETALIQAARRGVRVRLLVDGIGARAWWEDRSEALIREGVEVRVYHPLVMGEVWARLRARLTRGQWPWAQLLPQAREPKSGYRLSFLRRLNRRNHRKVSVIDEQTAFVGSINVSRTHCAEFMGQSAWRDTAVELRGPAISDLRDAFDHAWNRSPGRHELSLRPRLKFTFPRRGKSRHSPVGLNFTRRLRRQHRMKFAERLDRAQTRIYIENAYLAPTSNVSRRLAKAARRGVDVRIIVPSRSDVWFMLFIARAHYRRLLKAGVRIFEYQPRFLHAKSLVIDDMAVIGSSNLNRRSLLHDLEVDVLLLRSESITQLTQSFELDQAQSIEIFDRGTIVGSRLGRLLSAFFRYWV